MCAEGQSTLAEVDKLAEQFNVVSGKWLVFISSDEVDNLLERIAKSTLSGTLGNSAKVSTHSEEDPDSKHVICVNNADYRSIDEVNRVRDELRRLGVTQRIAYINQTFISIVAYIRRIAGEFGLRAITFDRKQSWETRIGQFFQNKKN